MLNDGPTPDDFRAKVFEDRETPGSWRVEKMDEDGAYEVVKVFTGTRARQLAINYAEREFGQLRRDMAKAILAMSQSEPRPSLGTE